MTHPMIPAATGYDLIRLAQQTSAHGGERDICPRCRALLQRAALVDLVYVFDRCTCDAAAYDHLVEQLWHRICFAEGADHD